MTNESRHVAGPIYSALADDEDLASLVDMFVADLPDRVQALLDHLQASQRSGLRHIAHQLRGAGGSYGFAEISTAASSLEEIIDQARPEPEIAGAANLLIDICRRARPGSPHKHLHGSGNAEQWTAALSR